MQYLNCCNVSVNAETNLYIIYPLPKYIYQNSDIQVVSLLDLIKFSLSCSRLSVNWMRYLQIHVSTVDLGLSYYSFVNPVVLMLPVISDCRTSTYSYTDDSPQPRTNHARLRRCCVECRGPGSAAAIEGPWRRTCPPSNYRWRGVAELGPGDGIESSNVVLESRP